jgi:RNA polymerase sigma-70 factor, ECF subfamily
LRPEPPDDASRFAVLYSQHRDRVYAYAVSKAGRQLADDILSEVFIVPWRRFGAVPDPPLPCLFAVARNIAMSKTRAAARERSLASQMGNWLSQAELTVTDIADGVADRVAILTALARLPERDRDLLMLVAWHDLPPKAAARVVGCSTATFFVRLHRARRRLEQALAGVETDLGARHASTSRQSGASTQEQLP